MIECLEGSSITKSKFQCLRVPSAPFVKSLLAEFSTEVMKYGLADAAHLTASVLASSYSSNTAPKRKRCFLITIPLRYAFSVENTLCCNEGAHVRAVMIYRGVACFVRVVSVHLTTTLFLSFCIDYESKVFLDGLQYGDGLMPAQVVPMRLKAVMTAFAPPSLTQSSKGRR